METDILYEKETKNMFTALIIMITIVLAPVLLIAFIGGLSYLLANPMFLIVEIAVIALLVNYLKKKKEKKD